VEEKKSISINLLRDESVCGWAFYGALKKSTSYWKKEMLVFDCPLYFEEVLSLFNKTFEMVLSYSDNLKAEVWFFVRFQVSLGEPYAVGTRYKMVEISKSLPLLQEMNSHIQDSVKEQFVGGIIKEAEMLEHSDKLVSCSNMSWT